jgi:hypothetical protein
MRFSGFSRAALLSTSLAILLLGTMTVMAKDGRDFAGTYGFTEVQEQGDMVHLTLHLRLFNYSDTDIKGAVVVLQEGPPGVALRGNFPTVKVWHKNRDVQLVQEFTVPKREYQDWLQPPAQPNVFIIYQDANGRTWQRGAQMRPQPVL